MHIAHMCRPLVHMATVATASIAAILGYHTDRKECNTHEKDSIPPTNSVVSHLENFEMQEKRYALTREGEKALAVNAVALLTGKKATLDEEREQLMRVLHSDK